MDVYVVIVILLPLDPFIFFSVHDDVYLGEGAPRVRSGGVPEAKDESH